MRSPPRRQTGALGFSDFMSPKLTGLHCKRMTVGCLRERNATSPACRWRWRWSFRGELGGTTPVILTRPWRREEVMKAAKVLLLV
jgi:hypothetical protein